MALHMFLQQKNAPVYHCGKTGALNFD